MITGIIYDAYLICSRHYQSQFWGAVLAVPLTVYMLACVGLMILEDMVRGKL